MWGMGGFAQPISKGVYGNGKVVGKGDDAYLSSSGRAWAHVLQEGRQLSDDTDYFCVLIASQALA